MNVVGYGGGTDSTAMLIGLWKNHIPVDLILFADPGGEQSHTYAYLEIMDRWLKDHDTWTRGEKVVKFIGYDAGEERRRQGAVAHDLLDKKYQKQYPLMDWGWRRTDCIQAIQSAGLPLPGKSSCFFCPSMKRREIRTLYHRYPDLLARALAIEETAMPNLISVKGLGRDWAWRDFITADENQMVIPGAFSDEDLPCACRLESEKPELP